MFNLVDVAPKLLLSLSLLWDACSTYYFPLLNSAPFSDISPKVEINYKGLSLGPCLWTTFGVVGAT